MGLLPLAPEGKVQISPRKAASPDGKIIPSPTHELEMQAPQDPNPKEVRPHPVAHLWLNFD